MHNRSLSEESVLKNIIYADWNVILCILLCNSGSRVINVIA